MFAEKIKAALDLLSNNMNSGIHHLDELSDPENMNSPTVREILKSKHPSGQHLKTEYIVPLNTQDIHQVVFDSIDANWS